MKTLLQRLKVKIGLWKCHWGFHGELQETGVPWIIRCKRCGEEGCGYPPSDFS